jgi:glycosyltransferase involved in cell wall biosynthesis
MKVVIIYRQRLPGAHSIEELFHAVAGELTKEVEVIEYEASSPWLVLFDAWQLRKLKADIYHVTAAINYIVLLLPRKKTVLTVPDIGHYMSELKSIKRWIYKWLWLILPIRAARGVTAISEETSRNIVKHLHIAGNRCIEIIECCHSAILKPVKKPFADGCPVVLQVGTQPYKNVPRLVEALKGLRCHLVLIGSLDDEIKQKLARNGVSYENHVGITHEEIYKRYVECDIVSFVSLSEGFGVPIIEAQAVGRPLITADISPLCDVAGAGACLVDPLDVSQIRAGIQRIIGDETYRNQIIECGFQNVSRYSPATISSQYLALYKKLMLT